MNNLVICSTLSNKFAAEELQKYWSLSTGTKIPIVNKSDGPAIVLSLDRSTEDRDRFSIHADNGNLFIIGANERSVLYGVYAFLEQCIGIRFYTPDHEYIPSISTFVVPAHYEYQETADFKIRQIRLEWSLDLKMIDWITKNRFNSITADFWCWEKPETQDIITEARKRGLMVNVSGHAMFYLLPADKYFAKHPEWFPEINGKRTATKNTGDNFCYSNAEAIETFIQNLLEYVKNHPGMNINLWPGDGGAVCQCPQCREKSFMALYTDLIAKVRLRTRELNTSVEVGQLSYNFDLKDKGSHVMQVPPHTPETPTMFAFWGQNLSIPLAENSDPGHQRVLEYIRKYCERAPHQASILSYHGDTYMNSNMCPVFDKSMATDFQTYKQLGIDEMCLLWIPWDEKEIQHTYWIAYQNGGLWGRLSMNPGMDLRAYRHYYYQTTYGISQATEVELLWDELNCSLGKLSALISLMSPPRASDAWGCGFNREVMKWDLSTDYGLPGQKRLAVFNDVAKELADLQDKVNVLNDREYPECARFKGYIQHCARRAKGLALIFKAQYKLQMEEWDVACELLEQALAISMTEEQKQTKYWLQYAENK